MVQVPARRKVSVPPVVMVQTDVVDDVNATGRPEVAEAVSVGDVPKLWVPGLVKAMLWEPAVGVMLADAVLGEDVPTPFVAVTVNV